MANRLEEDMLVRHMDLRRKALSSNGGSALLSILIEHMDGTEYVVNVSDRRGTPEYLTAVLAAVARGANLMIRALDILRTVGYMDVRPIALPGRHIVFGLDRVALELEIIENSNDGVSCGIAATGRSQGDVEEVQRVLEENSIVCM